MKEMKVYCDHCHKEVDVLRDYCGITIKVNHMDVDTDLCENCFDNLVAKIGTFLGGEME